MPGSAGATPLGSGAALPLVPVGVTATVSALEPKGLRARLRRIKPRNLAIAGAVAATVLVAGAVVAYLTLGPGPEQDRPTEYAFDSEAIHTVTDAIAPTVTPGGPDSSGDPNALWDYNVAPLTPGGTGPGSSKYVPPYRSGSSGHFIPYSPPNGSSGSSGPPVSGGDSPIAPQAMPPGSYGYGGAGTVPTGFWSKVAPVPESVTANVTSGDGGCSTVALGAGATTVSSTYCATGGELSAGPRARSVPNGQLSMTCSGPLIPAGAASGQVSEVDCKAKAFALEEDLHGTSVVSDTGSAWVATTTVSASSGDMWAEQVTIDKANGTVLGLQTNVRVAVLGYVESSTFTLR